MLAEQLQGLSADLRRLLMTGAAAAVEDPGLRRRAQALRELARKVPALTPLADAVEKVTRSGVKDVTPNLLQLVLVVRQVRGSLAPGGADGTAQPADPSGPWSTATNSREVLALADLIEGSSEKRATALEQAAERPGFADLRLLPVLLDSLNTTSDDLAEALLKKALPAYGSGLAQVLRDSLNLEGDRRDTRKLELLCRLDKEGARALCQTALEKGNWLLKEQALRSLAEADPAEGERVAMQMLQDKPVPQVRGAALAALGRSKSNQALDRLLEGLGASDAVHRGAVEGLKQSPHPRVAQRLREALEAAVVEVESLTPAPGKGKKAPKPPPLSKKDQARYTRVRQMIMHVGELLVARADLAGIARLLELFRHPVGDVRESARSSFSEIGANARPAVPLLLEALKTDDEDARATLAEALGEIGPAAPEALPALVRLLDDKRWWVQSNVIDALERFGELAVGPLSEALQSDSPEVRATAASALGNLGDKALGVLPQLVPLLKDKSAEVRRQVTYALGQIAEEAPDRLAPQIVPVLTALLTDKDKDVRQTAFLALRNFGPEGKAALPVLVRALKDKDADVRRLAAHGLGALGPEARSAIPELKKLLKDRSTYVRNSVKHILDDLGAS
jgi:HEAT repeat protein